MNNSTTNTKDKNIVMNDTNAGTITPSENMDNAAALDMPSPDNLSDVIPEEEQAVTETDSSKKHIPIVVATIEPSEDMRSEIPEEEQEDLKESKFELTESTKLGCFAPVIGMKGFITDSGHRFFAKIYITLNGASFLDYRQQYSNGDFSAKMRIKQSDLLFASTYRFISENVPDKPMGNKLSKFLMSVTEDYYSKLLFPKEGLDIVSILNLLVGQYETLPVEKEAVPLLEDPKKLYPRVIQIIKKKWSGVADEHNAYYTLDKDCLMILADELNVKKGQLLKKLAEYRFLYLTESSEGYQTCVRFKAGGEFFQKGYTKWCYCILNLEYLSRMKAQKKEK